MFPNVPQKTLPERMPQALDVNDFHAFDDVDHDDLAHHHTLGTGEFQAAKGTHTHANLLAALALATYSDEILTNESTTSTTFTDLTTVGPVVTFVAPDSGEAVAFYSTWTLAAGAAVVPLVTIKVTDVDTSTVFLASSDNNAATIGNNATNSQTIFTFKKITGLTPGHTYSIKMQYRGNNAGVSMAFQRRKLLVLVSGTSTSTFTPGVSFVQASTLARDNSNTGTVTVTIPTPTAGNKLVLCYYDFGGGSPGTPAGWTLTNTYSGANGDIHIYTKTSTGSETSVAVSGGAFAAACTIEIHGFSSISQFVGTASSGAASALTLAAGDLNIIFAGNRTGNAISSTPPGGYTLAVASLGSANTNAAAFYQSYPAGGSTGTPTVTPSASYAIASIAIS